MISVIIAYKDDHDLIGGVINALTANTSPNNVEVIVSDDGSSTPIPQEITYHHNVGVKRSVTNDGVGSAFDKGVAASKGDILLLIGSDVFVNAQTWYDDVLTYAAAYPDAMICSACEDNDTNKIVGYGADIAWRHGSDKTEGDKQPLFGDYDIIQAKWRKDVPHDAEVPCVLGAAYVISRELYNKIGGWDCHIGWGGLEPHISIKVWLSGGRCVVARDFVTRHVFNRFTDVMELLKKRSLRYDQYFYNKLFIAETMILNPYRDIITSHLPNDNAVSIARLMIKDNSALIEKKRKEYDKLFERDATFLFSRFSSVP